MRHRDCPACTVCRVLALPSDPVDPAVPTCPEVAVVFPTAEPELCADDPAVPAAAGEVTAPVEVPVPVVGPVPAAVPGPAAVPVLWVPGCPGAVPATPGCPAEPGADVLRELSAK